MTIDKEQAKEKGKGLWAEFKEFISQGSVMDLAVGMIIGAAFTAIVSSLVNDIVMPVVGVIIGGLDFADIKTSFVSPTTGQTVNIMWGSFITAVINFLLIALVIFLMVKAVNTAHDKIAKKGDEEEAQEVEKVSDEVKLLTEIRDALVNKDEK